MTLDLVLQGSGTSLARHPYTGPGQAPGGPDLWTLGVSHCGAWGEELTCGISHQ